MANNSNENLNTRYEIDKQPAYAHSINSTELAKLENARNIAYTKDVNRNKLEMNKLGLKTIWEAGLLAVKSAIVINGSAAVALLSFLGNVTSKINVNKGMVIWGTEVLYFFAIGTIVAAMATGGTYLAQCCYFEWNSRKWGNYFRLRQCF